MKSLLLVRHGQTQWNAEDRIQGETDVPLTAEGRAQVERLAARLAEAPPSVIYASDLSRAQETASTVAAACGCAVRPDARLRAPSRGVWEGLTWAEIVARYPEQVQAWQADRHSVPPGGESFDSLVDRLRGLLSDLHQRHPAQTVLAAAHGVPLRLLICLALGIDPALTWNFHVDNASISDLQFEPEGAVLVRLNDCCHLR